MTNSMSKREAAELCSPLLLTMELPEIWPTMKLEYQRADLSWSKKTIYTTQAETPENVLFAFLNSERFAKSSIGKVKSASTSGVSKS